MGDYIFHIDVNSAFLAWESVHRLNNLGGTLDLRDIPSAIGGDKLKRSGIILAKSIPAKKYKIHTGELIHEAIQKCPDLVIVPPHYNLYESASKAFVDILKQYTPDVEQYSIDECYFRMSAADCYNHSPVMTAHLIKDRIYSELGFTVNVGISYNKLLAKMASDFQKPDMVHTLFPHEIQKKMWGLPVEDLFYVGRATKIKMHKLGITTIGELAQSDLRYIKSHLKKHGELIWHYANGLDVSIVEPTVPANKGYGNSTTIPFDVDSERDAHMVLLALSETVCTRLRNDNVQISVVAVSIVYSDFAHLSHQMTLNTPTNVTKEIHEISVKLFEQAWNGLPVRHLGIHASRVNEERPERQMNMFDSYDYDRLGKLDAAVDDIRRRYGRDSIFRASFLGSKVYHSSGGISKEKMNIDYDKVEVF